MDRDAEDFLAAKAAAPYRDDAAIGDMTKAVMRAGHSVLEIFRLGRSDEEHVERLLERFHPAKGAVVLDAGCGVGRVAELMQAARPDLRFILLNLSPAQLRLCDDPFPRIAADFHAIPLADSSVDAVMVNYALGHAYLPALMPELARVLRPGGRLFIYDIAGGNSAVLIAHLGYQAHAPERVIATSRDAGLTLLSETAPRADASAFKALFGHLYFDAILAGVRPAAYLFEKAAA